MKSVFITGGTSGIGERLAKDFYDKGYRVGICARNKSKFDEKFKNYKISFYQVDTTKFEEVKSAVDDFSKHGLDIVIANAGKAYNLKTAVPDFKDCKEIVNVNVIGVINTFEIATKYFLESKKGHLVAIASLAGFNGLPGAAAYSASKSAVIKYCESLSLSLANKHIDVTCICPGFIKTPLTERNNHPMPFLTDVNEASLKFIGAIESKRKLFIYPRFFGQLVNVLGNLPRFIFRFIIKNSKLNYTKNQ